MSGHVGDLSVKQKEKLSKFQENLKDVIQPKHTDELLLKFLRARRFDVKKSELMFRKDLQWREENKIDTIMEWFEVPEILQTHWPGGISGVEKDGHAVMVMDLGNVDPKGILYSAKKSDILKTNIFYMEQLLQEQRELSIKKCGNPVDGSICVIDLEKLGTHHLWSPAIELLQKLATISEQHYPEVIHRMYVVKAPKVFPIAYSLLRPFLHDDTRKKIHILGSNWKEELAKAIDPDQLPAHWGGTKTDPDGDPMCKSLIKPGGIVPKSCYLKDREPTNALTDRELSRGGHLEFKYDVVKPNAVLRWVFQTVSSPIKFGIERVDEKGGKKAVVMKQEKYNSHMVPENGEIEIPEIGSYVVRFDSDILTKTQKLSYWLELLEPTDEEPEFKEMSDDLTKLDADE